MKNLTEKMRNAAGLHRTGGHLPLSRRRNDPGVGMAERERVRRERAKALRERANAHRAVIAGTGKA